MSAQKSDYTPVRIVVWILVSIGVGLAELVTGHSVGASVLFALLFAAVLLGTYDLIVLVKHGTHLHLSWGR